MAYIAIARGSPWTVPSCNSRVSLIYISIPDLWVLIRALDSRGHHFISFICVTFVAWTIRKASVSEELKIVLTACTAASHQLVWPAHNCRAPIEFKISMERTEAMALHIILLRHSPMSMGRTPGHLSRKTSLLAMRGLGHVGQCIGYSSYNTMMLAHRINQMHSS